MARSFARSATPRSTSPGTGSTGRTSDPTSLPLYEDLIVTGAWWDFVDEIAARRVGPILRAAPVPDGPGDACRGRRMRTSGAGARRSCANSGARDSVDRDLLADCLEPNLADREFFIRKAIGWALRDYARQDPWVRALVDRHAARLSPLSYREANQAPLTALGS